MASPLMIKAMSRLKEGNFTLPSPEDVRAAESGNGGWTAMQLAEWGIAWPPAKGWRDELRKKWENTRVGEPKRKGRDSCAICDKPTQAHVITSGMNDEGTLRVFYFCSPAHIQQWQADNPFP